MNLRKLSHDKNRIVRVNKKNGAIESYNVLTRSWETEGFIEVKQPSFVKRSFTRFLNRII